MLELKWCLGSGRKIPFKVKKQYWLIWLILLYLSFTFDFDHKF